MEKVFEKAKSLVTFGLIKKYVDSPGSFLKGNNFFSLNPLRTDNNIGSFSVDIVTGKFYDYATNQGGSFIDLVAQIKKIEPIDAARLIISESGETMSDTIIQPVQKIEKFTAKIITAADLPGLNKHVIKQYFRNRYGKPIAGHKYINVNGEIEYCQVRFVSGNTQKNGKNEKTDLPFFFGEDNKWHAGLPKYYKTKKLPLYNEHLLTPDTKNILLVEGCKCGDVQIPGWTVLSWGSCQQVGIRRWEAVQDIPGARVVIWPDKDLQKDLSGNLKSKEQQPGFSAVLRIAREYLPGAEILDVYAYDPDNKLKHGWDCADAGNPLEIIENCPRYQPPTPRNSKIDALFKFLGYHDGYYYFLPDAAPSPVKMKSLSLHKTGLLTIAPLDYWIWKSPGGSRSVVDWDVAIDWINRESQKAGPYDQNSIRTAGFWHEGDEIICNTGREILHSSGKIEKYKDLMSNNIYVESQNIHSKKLLKSNLATDDQGRLLIELFEAYGFESKLQAWEMLGWSLMAPFSQLFDWRPCCWLTGKSQSGKSHTLENAVMPLLSDFAFVGNDETTPAVARATAAEDQRVMVLDEMECRKAKTGKAEIIERMTAIARNSTCKQSSYGSKYGADGSKISQRIQSTFLFSSIIPHFSGAAIENRFFTPTIDSGITIKEKKSKIYNILKTNIMSNPTIFLRRNFQNIKNIIKNTDLLKGVISDMLQDQRKADNYAPIFAFIFALENSGEITPKFVASIESMLVEIKDKVVRKDEDILFEELFTSKIRTEGSDEKTIFELLDSVMLDNEETKKENLWLARHGIGYNRNQDVIAIHTNNPYLRELLRNTDFAGNYSIVLRRHPLMKEIKQIRIGGYNCLCVIFNYVDFRKIMGIDDI